ncbi:MAG: hypothetical protein DCC75_09540 [Proteobacteria bacterium]|nr:MAG: hypothetical protein DCC75_09540 [Pseudomonadota bacterium]
MPSSEINLGGARSSSAIENTPLVKVFDNYTHYYAAGESHTARAKRLDIQCFIKFLCSYRGCSKPEKLKIRDWDFSSVQRFIDECLAEGQAPATVTRRLATLKHMGRTLADKVAGFVNPAREVKSPKVPAGKPKALTKQELRMVRSRARERRKKKQSFIRIRNATIFEFLVDTGIRADEVRMLKRSQVDDKLEWVKSVRTKGRRFRNVYITTALRPRLREYLEAREKELKRYFAKLNKPKDGSLPFFISNYGCKPDKPESFMMGAKTIWRAINELSADTKLHPHLLRHSYALDLLKDSGDIRLVSQALGHSDVKITMRYTERKDEEVARALEKARRRG